MVEVVIVDAIRSPLGLISQVAEPTLVKPAI